MHLKVFMKLKKTLKTLSSGQINNKNPKKPTGVKKNRVFSNPARIRISNTLNKDISLCI